MSGKVAAVVVTKSELRCKCCSLAARSTLDNYLLRWKNGESDGDKKITLPFIGKSIYPVLAGDPDAKLSESSLKRHLTHIEFVGAEEAEAKVQAAAEAESSEKDDTLAILERVLGSDWRTRTATPDQLLELQRAVYVAQLYRDVADGRPVRLSHDQAVRAVAEATKRKGNEAQGELLRALTGGLTQVFTRAIAEGELEAGELEAGEGVEDAEFEELDGDV